MGVRLHLVAGVGGRFMVIHRVELRECVSHFEAAVNHLASVGMVDFVLGPVMLADGRVQVDLRRIHWFSVPVEAHVTFSEGRCFGGGFHLSPGLQPLIDAHTSVLTLEHSLASLHLGANIALEGQNFFLNLFFSLVFLLDLLASVPDPCEYFLLRGFLPV